MRGARAQDRREKHYKMRKRVASLDWFMKNNAKAYMVLLD